LGLAGVAGELAKKPAAPKPPAFLNEADCDADFKVQGEYVGEVTAADGSKKKLAAQIIACGKGEFHSAFFPGGLPGDGWDGQTKIEKTPAKQGNIPVDGKTEGDKTVIDQVYKATIAGGVLTGQTDKGEKFELKRVARQSPALGAKPPEGAVVLFDGSNTDEWDKPNHMDDRKLLKAGCTTKRKFGSFTLHVEFLLPYKPGGRGQDRGNSGVYLQERYEIQVLDSFCLAGDDNECGGFYKQARPKVNMCLTPLTWQTYDVEFTAAKVDDGGAIVKPAMATVKHNSVVIHENQELKSGTGSAQKKQGPPVGGIHFQDHGNPVFYRNVWIVEKK
jgi:hypothetical protein